MAPQALGNLLAGDILRSGHDWSFRYDISRLPEWYPHDRWFDRWLADNNLWNRYFRGIRYNSGRLLDGL